LTVLTGVSIIQFGSFTFVSWLLAAHIIMTSMKMVVLTLVTTVSRLAATQTSSHFIERKTLTTVWAITTNVGESLGWEDDDLLHIHLMHDRKQIYARMESCREELQVIA
jgi:hypothetical protein